MAERAGFVPEPKVRDGDPPSCPPAHPTRLNLRDPLGHFRLVAPGGVFILEWSAAIAPSHPQSGYNPPFKKPNGMAVPVLPPFAARKAKMKKSRHGRDGQAENKMAERARFELAVPVRVHTLSKRAPSATRTPLLRKRRYFTIERTAYTASPPGGHSMLCPYGFI